MLKSGELKVGYYGVPSREALAAARARFPGGWIDLDIGIGAPENGLLPKTACRILQNIIDNALFRRKEIGVILASVGEEKCDGGRFVARILTSLGFPVTETRQDASAPSRPIRLCAARVPLREKIQRIMNTVHTDDRGPADPCPPSAGFWGVPPHDPSILDLFPDTTHIYGWTRCVEAGRPADLSLECFIQAGVRTVFFTQSFCAKSVLAKGLAEKHRGLIIDADGEMSEAVRAKIEAFLAL